MYPTSVKVILRVSQYTPRLRHLAASNQVGENFSKGFS